MVRLLEFYLQCTMGTIANKCASIVCLALYLPDCRLGKGSSGQIVVPAFELAGDVHSKSG